MPQASRRQLRERPGWRKTWEPKVFGYVNLMREYFRHMRERRSGVIINIIGLGAEKVDYDYAAGSAGNAALAALTRAVDGASLDEGVTRPRCASWLGGDG